MNTEYQEVLEMALNARQIGVWQWFPKEDKLVWDDRMHEIYGISKKEFSGTYEDWEACLRISSKEIWQELQNSVQYGIPFETTFEINRKGETRYIAAYALSRCDEYGEIEYMAGCNYDITKAKVIEEELRRSNQELERFAYAASHDLKEPIRTIGGFATLLNKKYREDLNTQGQKFLDFILDGCLKMQNLIDSLLKYSKVERELGEDFEVVDIQEKVRKVCEYLIAKAVETDAKITWDDMPEVYTHDHLIFEVFLNLVQNAMKFKDENRSCVIHIQCKDIGHLYQFDIIDNGKGIEEKYLDNIFEVFYRLHDRSVEGTGIGLALCKKIIQSLGGEIWVESEFDKGSTFSFTLPKRGLYDSSSRDIDD